MSSRSIASDDLHDGDAGHVAHGEGLPAGTVVTGRQASYVGQTPRWAFAASLAALLFSRAVAQSSLLIEVRPAKVPGPASI